MLEKKIWFSSKKNKGQRSRLGTPTSAHKNKNKNKNKNWMNMCLEFLVCSYLRRYGSITKNILNLEKLIHTVLVLTSFRTPMTHNFMRRTGYILYINIYKKKSKPAWFRYLLKNPAVHNCYVFLRLSKINAPPQTEIFCRFRKIWIDF